MNTEDFVTYEQALALKKLGFDWPTYYHYCQGDGTDNVRYSEEPLNWNNGTEIYSAPELYMTQKWLREVKEIDVLVFNCACGYGWEISKAGNEQSRGTIIMPYDDKGEDEASGMWLSYEAALSAGITECLKLLERK